jgi:predicted membrane metal-binding protein
MIQEMWKKLNANERLVAWGAIVVLVSFLVGIVSGGIGWSWFAAVAVLVIYWLKYTPNQTITWPAPVPTIVLIVAGISAILAVLALLSVLSVLGLAAGLYAGFFVGYILSGLANAVGSVMMALGAWREYQAQPKSPTPPSA